MRSELCTPTKRKYFSVRNYFVQYPNVLTRSSLNSSSLSKIFLNKQIENENSMFLHWHCNYGVLVYSFGENFYCFCSPAYYGDRCQYQNDFIGLILTVRRKSIRDHLFLFRIMIILLDQNMTSIYREQILYVSDCEKRYQIYLLYRNRLKLNYQNYSVRLDIYSIHRFDNTIHFRTSFYYTIPFTFLPVNRLLISLNISDEQPQMTFGDKFSCQNGKYYQYENLNKTYCRCNTGWFGKFCHLRHECNCSPQSICAELSCVCPLGKFGPLCYFPEKLTCKNIVCQHGGTCIPRDQRILEKDSQCVCTEEFEGQFCEKRRMRIIVSFDNVPIPSSLLVHYFISRESRNPDRLTSFKRISYMKIWLFYIRQYVKTTIIGSNKCPNIEDIFDHQIFQFHPLKRIKYYQLICQQNHRLKCFFDETQLCLCTKDNLADCFDFNHNGISLCDENNVCQNNGKCYVNDLKCPTKSLCVCQQCYHGTLCQFTTSGSVLSLDSIIGYHIQSYVQFSKQYFIIKLSTGITIVMATTGILSNVFAIMTFSRERVLELGCGFYLLSSSIASLSTMIIFVYKLLSLFVTQMELITNDSYLNVNCKMTNFLLKFLPTTVEWLNACVASERALSILLGIHFNKIKSKFWSKFTIGIVILINITSALHDPLNRRLLKDTEEQRIWCIADYSYSSWLNVYNAAVNIIHFIVPFVINCLSACIIITVTARNRSVIRTNQTYREHLTEQFQRHKHLLISSSVLVILGISRLIISYFSGCMKSARNPWLFLAAYFISFVPPMLTFPIFIIPSKSYRTEFYASIKYRHTTS
ncbi:unnamed protein product [Didymodactylos carnosus]|uniref:EGF-like domain-containing protein n=1 Tax=Didymodactylos carnosus TaxID=1234261 RepID=A0A8S2RPF6_9BILA|nr:unnamed protein product [Didymodactylos carnosus]CAF4176538.1 unnamed protein product [Didymodactylos carnosus]